MKYNSKLQNTIKLKAAESSLDGLGTVKLNLYYWRDPNPKGKTKCIPHALIQA